MARRPPLENRTARSAEPHGRRSRAALLQAQRVRQHGGVMAAPSRSERQTRMQDEAHRGSVGPIT